MWSGELQSETFSNTLSVNDYISDNFLLIFCCRNLNTIRGIARTHGDPLDRPAYMARYAQGCIYRLRRGEYFQSIKWLIRRIRFDYHFIKLSLQYWFIRAYLNALSALGRSSKNANEILNYSADA